MQYFINTRQLLRVGRGCREVQPLLGLMREIGAAHGGKTPSQVTIKLGINVYGINT